MKALLNLFKLRIGVAIALAAAAGLVVQDGKSPGIAASAMLVLAVLVASAAAGAFNQYVEVDLDRRMSRTQGRPFVTGVLDTYSLEPVMNFGAAVGQSAPP